MLTMIHDLIAWAPLGLPAFIFVIGAVVFIHELGHFLAGRACGVGVKSFSIGFGPEIFGWNDKYGTRWKLSWLPLGGYVMFEGDANVASVADSEAVAKMSPEERARALPLKPLWQRMVVTAAGPVANFILAFVVFTALYAIAGVRLPSTYVGAVENPSPAMTAGIKPGDKIVAVDGKPVRLFTPDLTQAIRTSKAKTQTITLERDGRRLDVVVTPAARTGKDLMGDTHNIPRGIGVRPDEESLEKAIKMPVPLAKAPLLALDQCWAIVDTSLTYVWRIASRRADGSQLGGPIRIATVAKSAASTGFYSLISLIAVISVSIGLINLFPIPLLDGGHLLYYACEGVLGRPLPERVQDVGFRLGLVLVLGLMIFATWNDLVR